MPQRSADGVSRLLALPKALTMFAEVWRRSLQGFYINLVHMGQSPTVLIYETNVFNCIKFIFLKNKSKYGLKDFGRTMAIPHNYDFIDFDDISHYRVKVSYHRLRL